jgi:hypothetical protein
MARQGWGRRLRARLSARDLAGSSPRLWLRSHDDRRAPLIADRWPDHRRNAITRLPVGDHQTPVGRRGYGPKFATPTDSE